MNAICLFDAKQARRGSLLLVGSAATGLMLWAQGRCGFSCHPLCPLLPVFLLELILTLLLGVLGRWNSIIQQQNRINTGAQKALKHQLP